jgi:hypothetical protein
MPLGRGGGPLKGKWSGPLWQFVRDHVPAHLDETILDASAIWYSGAYLLETVPTVLHILARYIDEPREAIVRAVNDTADNDSIASIVAAAVGARHGIDIFPHEWKSEPARYYLFEKQAWLNGVGGYRRVWNRYGDYTSSAARPAWLSDPAAGYVTPLSQNALVYDHIADNGHQNIGRWIDRAAQSVGR